MPITAADLLYDRVLPFYEAPGLPVGAVLTDNGRVFCGKPEPHTYELLEATRPRGRDEQPEERSRSLHPWKRTPPLLRLLDQRRVRPFRSPRPFP